MSNEHNFVFPVRILESERVKLEPFEASRHARPMFETASASPILWSLLPFGPFEDVQAFTAGFVDTIERDPAIMLFAILVKPQKDDAEQSEKMAGTIAFINSSPAKASTEIGRVIVFPAYQRTFVATNAVGLLLQYGLDAPSQGGLGLRRVQWQAAADNEASIRLAKRMLMTFEGIARWERTIDPGKMGNGVDIERLREAERYSPGGSGVQRPGRHSALLAMCWDDWLIDGKRDLVLQLMDRRS